MAASAKPCWRCANSNVRAELKEKVDIHIERKETKRGRSVHSLQFTFTFVKKEKAVQTELDL
jgi:plasmid replication initiation protein